MKLEFKDCPESIDQSKLFGFKSWQEHETGEKTGPRVGVIESLGGYDKLPE